MNYQRISNKKRYLSIIVGALLIALGFSLGWFSVSFVENREPEEKRFPAIANDNRTFFWDIYPDLVIPNLGKKISGDLNLLDSNGTVISLAEIPNNFPLLVLRYSKFDCHICVNQVLSKLNALFEGKENHICLFVDGYTARDLRLSYKDSDLNFPIYILENEKLGLNIENKNLPFMFMFESKDFEINKIFIPFKEHSRQTDIYLQQIIKHLEQ